MTASSPMEVIGQVDGVTWYWAAPGNFTNPGVYYWNGLENVRVVPNSTTPAPTASEPRDAHFGGNSYEASMLRDLLARIHGDGGHYVAVHGLEQAMVVADALVAEWRAALTEQRVAPEAKPVAWHITYEGHTRRTMYETEWEAQKECKRLNTVSQCESFSVSALYAAPVSGDEALLDSQRLDWLDKMNATLNARYGTTYGWKLVLSSQVTRLMSEAPPVGSGYLADIDLHDSQARGAKSCRAAIDAAMKGTP